MARRIACLVTAALLAATLPAVASADGDPASDFLLAQNVFYPFQPPVDRSLQRILNAETAATQRAGLPLKVAIIHSQGDLGAVPTVFGHPQGYAAFLDREISFDGARPLLVVMPDGYGVAGLPAAARAAVRTIRPPAGRTSDDLARAAVSAVPRIAAAAGHPIPAAGRLPGAATGGSPTWPIAVGLAVAAVVAAVGLLTLRHRDATRRAARPRSAVRSRR